METRTTIDDAFEEVGLRRGGELYVSIEDALQLVHQCAEENRAVVGVEGVKLGTRTTQPVPDAVADFSFRDGQRWLEFVESCREDAVDFLHQLDSHPDLYVTLTVLSSEEWERLTDPGESKGQ
jgi:hypothetical protein